MTTSNWSRRQRRRAFSLVELAIVLVIIGLLAGGVLVGQDLIRAAELNSTISSFSKYNTAIQSFLGKYNGLPGDFTMASDFGIHSSGGTNNVCEVNSAATSSAGDDDGLLEKWDGSANGAYNGEIANFWMHLSNAGMIEGQFSIPDAPDCSADPATYGLKAGTHLPLSSVGGGLIALTDATEAPRKNLYFVLGLAPLRSSAELGQSGGAGSIDQAPELTPYQALMIDEKLDDAQPSTGLVRAVKHWSHWANSTASFVLDDANSATACLSNGLYNATLEAKDCVLAIRH